MTRRRSTSNQGTLDPNFLITSIYALLTAIILISSVVANNILITRIILTLAIILALTIIFLVISVWLGKREYQKMTYCVTAQKFIVNTNQSQLSQTHSNQLLVMYGGFQVTKLLLLLIEFNNVGNTTITTEDYKKGITINFGPNANIIDASIKTNIDPIPEIDMDKQYITIKKFESEPHDAITLRVFLTSDEYKVRIDEKANNFSLRQVDNVNEARKKLEERIQNTLKFITIFLTIVCFGVFLMILFGPMLTINISVVLLALIINTIVYVCFSICRWFIFSIIDKVT